MPVSFDQFSAKVAGQNVRDGSIVRVDSRQDVKLDQSRFRLVRWARDTGIGKRLSNRRSVDAFMHSLHIHYRGEVTDRMDLGWLRDLHDRGKPLHVRDIKAAFNEADTIADDMKSAKSSKFGVLVDEDIAAAPYRKLPGGEALAREVRSKVNVDRIQEKFGDEQTFSARLGAVSGEARLSSARDWASQGIADAQKDVFLTGYGVKTGRGQEFGRLQQIFDRHTQSQALKKHYGLGFDASRTSAALHHELSVKLSRELSGILEHTERLPGEGPVKDRVMQVIDQRAERIVDEFIQERTVALERLSEMHARGEISSEDMASFGVDGHQSLADVVLHRKIPPAMLSRLYTLRSETPENLGDLASDGYTMEHRLRVLGQFGETVAGIETGLSEAEFSKYVSGAETKQSYIEDCSRFLLEGKLSADDASAIRHAVRTDPPGSNLSEMFRGIAAMRGALHDPNAQGHWAQARDPLDRLALAGNGLLGPDAPPLIGGDYTTDAGNVLTALRNCGIDTPPPDNYGEKQSGNGVFSRAALEIAQKEINEDLDDKRKGPSTEYPGFIAEAIKDFNRADFVISGSSIDRGDVPGVVEGIRKFCTDADGNPDGRMLDIVGKLVYQRSNSMGRHRFATGMGITPDDRYAMLKTAPFVGMPEVDYISTYTVDKTHAGNVLLEISSAGPTNIMNHPQGPHFLDEKQSKVAFNIKVEIDAQGYSARITDMGYEFQLVPAHKAS